MGSGSWEWKHSNQVVCAILHVEHTSIAWAFGLRKLQIPGPVMGVCGMPFDHARDTACHHALAMGYDYLFFLDSDVIPPPDAVYRLMAHNLPIVSGVYHRRSTPHGIPVMLKGGQWITHYPQNALIEVDLVGAGCLLLRRDLLEALVANPLNGPDGHTFFEWRVHKGHMLPKGEALSEDFAMNLHVRRMGYKVMVDTSIQCRHVGLAEAGYGSLLPCQAVA